MKPLIVGLGGTSRAGSTSEKALRWLLADVEQKGARTQAICGRSLDLPNYDPSDPHRTLAARRLVDLIRIADGIVLSSPAYHGGPSGLIKNAIDYVEDLSQEPCPYFDGRAVGVIVAAHGAQAMGTTITSMRSIIHALRGWPTPMAVALNGQDAPFDADGQPSAEVAKQLAIVADQVLGFARYRSAQCETRKKVAAS